MKRPSLSLSFFLLFLIITTLTIGASYSVLKNIYDSQLREQGRNIAENVEAFGTWVAKYGRVWVLNNDENYLGHMTVNEVNDKTITSDFYSKNPALAQREFSEIVETLPVNAKFRMTSHNLMNPNNKPDEFEVSALNIVRSQKLDEYDQLIDGVYRYTKTVYHEASCIVCHGDPANAPDDVTSQYGSKNGFGFKEGDVAGIISVRIPAKALFESVFSFFGIKEVALILIAFLIPAIFIRTRVIRPIAQLTEASKQISVGRNIDLDVGQINESTNNEIDQLKLATNRLRNTIQIAIKRLRAQK